MHAWSPPAFSSRWVSSGYVLPDFTKDKDAFAKGVLDLGREHPGCVVMPASDESIASLRPWRTDLEGHVRLALAVEEALAVAASKRRTLDLARSLHMGVPRSLLVSSPSQLPDALAEIGFPAVVKPDTSWDRERGGGRLVCRDVVDNAEAAAAVAYFGRAGVPCLVQEWVPGRRESVSLMRAGGRIVAEFAKLEIRTTPLLGGVSVLRESIPMPADLRRAAVNLIEAMGLDGYSEVEFRRDGSGRPLLMEVNARLSGSVELAVRAGVDFPLMLWQWAAGKSVEPHAGYRSGVKLRWLSGDIRWLLEVMQRQGRPDSVGRARAVAEFLMDFLRVGGYDMLDASDPWPAAVEMALALRGLKRNVFNGTKRARAEDDGKN